MCMNQDIAQHPQARESYGKPHCLNSKPPQINHLLCRSDHLPSALEPVFSLTSDGTKLLCHFIIFYFPH